MKYKVPDIPLIDAPVGLDVVIQSIQEDLATIPWLEQSFGRAWEHFEGGKRIPKVYVGNGEYFNVVPNDTLRSYSFIAVRGEESTPYYTGFQRNDKTRELSVIFWGNLRQIDPSRDYIYTERLKADFEAVLMKSEWVKSINRYFDERVEDIFDGYVKNNMSDVYSVDQPDTILMHPYTGFRIDFTVGYPQTIPGCF